MRVACIFYLVSLNLTQKASICFTSIYFEALEIAQFHEHSLLWNSQCERQNEISTIIKYSLSLCLGLSLFLSLSPRVCVFVTHSASLSLWSNTLTALPNGVCVCVLRECARVCPSLVSSMYYMFTKSFRMDLGCLILWVSGNLH